MRGGRGLVAVVAALAAAGAVAACSPNDPPGGENRLSVATGGSGGVYQVLGGGLAALMSDRLPDAPTTAETTSASVDNLLLVASGDSDVAFTLSDSAIDAVEGRASFDRPLPLRALATIYPNITQVVVKADSGIETIEDLRGKTVSIGAPNSGTEVIAQRLLAVAGVDPDADIGKRQLGVGESSAALRDGSIDAFFWSGGVPTGAITDLATTDDVRLLALDRYLPALRERYGEAYEQAEVEAGEYTGVPAVKTIGVPNMLVVNAGMDDDLAFRITKLLFDGKAELSQVHPSAETLEVETARRPVPPVQLHPGAQRYYDEAGGRAAAAPAPPRRRAQAAVAAAGEAPAPLAGGARVVARAGRAAVAGAALPASGRFALAYRHSVYGARAVERFRALRDGGFALEAVSSRSAAVLDYYGLEGRRTRRAGTWTLHLARSARFGDMALAATRVGRRTLVVAGRRTPLWRRDGRPAHVTIAVRGGRRGA